MDCSMENQMIVGKIGEIVHVINTDGTLMGLSERTYEREWGICEVGV